MTVSYDADVIVVGGGPVGSTALALLGQRGINAIGVEKDVQTWPTARAVHFDGETFRTLQSLGIAEALTELTLPMASMHVQNEAKEILVRLPTGQFGSQAWNDDINFHQPDVEEVVRATVDSLDSVELRSNVTATSVINTDDGVEATVIDGDGNQSILRARWLIAADGARSGIRQSLDIATDHFGEDAQWVVADGLLEDSPGYEDDMIFLGHYSRPALWVRLPGARVRMEFMLMPGDDPAEIVTPEAIERISGGILPIGKFTPDRIVIYTFRGRISQTWRVGNIFLAGDAAHQAPPLYGQGLCAGIRDVSNLVWKLDHVQRDLAPESLLDTYESERKPHATFWVEQAANAAVFVQTTNPETAAQRDAFLRTNPQAVAPESPGLGPGLHRGEPDAHAGSLSIQPLLQDGVRLDDVIGARYLIAAQREFYNMLPQTTRDQLENDEETVVLLDPAKIGSILTTNDALAVVIRPDRYILGTAQSAADLDQLVQLMPHLNRTSETVLVSGKTY